MPARTAASSSSGTRSGPAAITFWLPAFSEMNWMNLTPRSGSSDRSTMTISGPSCRSALTCSSSNLANLTGDSSASTTPNSERARAVLTWSEKPGSVEISAARRLRSFMSLRCGHYATALLDEPQLLDQGACYLAFAGALGEVEEPSNHRLMAVLLILDEDHGQVVELELRPPVVRETGIEQRHVRDPGAGFPVRIRDVAGPVLALPPHYRAAAVSDVVRIGRIRPARLRIERDQGIHSLFGRPDHVAGLVVVGAGVGSRVARVLHVHLHFDIGAGHDVVSVVRRAGVAARKDPRLEERRRNRPVRVALLEHDRAAVIIPVQGRRAPVVVLVVAVAAVPVTRPQACRRSGRRAVPGVVVYPRIPLPPLHLALALSEVLEAVGRHVDIVVGVRPDVGNGGRLDALPGADRGGHGRGLGRDRYSTEAEDPTEERCDPGASDDYPDLLAIGNHDDDGLARRAHGAGPGGGRHPARCIDVGPGNVVPGGILERPLARVCDSVERLRSEIGARSSKGGRIGGPLGIAPRLHQHAQVNRQRPHTHQRRERDRHQRDRRSALISNRRLATRHTRLPSGWLSYCCGCAAGGEACCCVAAPGTTGRVMNPSILQSRDGSPVGRGVGRSFATTSRGVTRTSSSVLRCRIARDLNSSHRRGISPRMGIFVTLLMRLLSSKPAMARYWPSRSSTSVSARRVRIVGISNPPMTRPFAKSSDETSGLSVSRMAPLRRITGVNRSLMPNSLKTTVTTLPALAAWSVGNGNSPPARK